MMLHTYSCKSLLIALLSLLSIVVYADFDPTNPPDPYATQQVTVGVTPTGAGKTSGAGKYLVGKSITISTTANKDYTFLYWTLNGNQLLETSTQFTYVVGDSVAAFVAHYEYVEPVPEPWVPSNPPEPHLRQHISVDLNPLEGGYTRGTGDYISGENVTITAIPYVNYAFKYWTINDYEWHETSESFTYVVGDSCVHFVGHLVEKHLLTLKTHPRAAGHSTMSINGEEIQDMLLAPNEVVDLTTTGNEDYVFRHWTINGYPLSTSSSYQYTMGDTTASIVAVYDYIGTGDTTMFNPNNPPEPLFREDVTVLVLSADESKGTVSGGGTYPFATIDTIKATPISGYAFRHWHDGNKEAIRTIRAERDTVYIAYFGNDTVVWNDTICYGETYTWYGQTLSSSGTYTYHELTESGGYITHELNLLVRPPLDIQFADTDFYYCSNDDSHMLDYSIVSGSPMTYMLSLKSNGTNNSIAMQWEETSMREGISIPTLPDSISADTYTLTIFVRDSFCNAFTQQLNLMVSYPSDMVITQRWNDVLAVRQSAYDYYNGFSAYQWYCDGNPVEGATQSVFYKPDGLHGSTYQVELTRSTDGVTILSCSFVPTQQPNTSTLVVTPTMVKQKNKIQLITPEQGKVSVISNMGSSVKHVMVQQGENQLAAPNLSGVYLIHLETHSGNKYVQKIIVY